MNSTLHGTETDRNRNCAGRKNKLLETASLLQIFGFRISGQNLRNRTRDDGNNNGQICDTQIGYLRIFDALRLEYAVMEGIREEKTNDRSHVRTRGISTSAKAWKCRNGYGR